GQWSKAEPPLRKLLDPATGTPASLAATARRELALALAQRGSYRQFQEALTLVEEGLKISEDGIADRRAKALVLATQPAHRREAIRLFESLAPQQSFTQPDIQFVVARLYEADGNWSKSRAHMLALLGSQDKNPVFLAHYARS